MEPIFQFGNCLTILVEPDVSIVAVYRSPNFRIKSEIDSFLNSLDTILSGLNSKTCILTGDINIDIAPYSSSRDSDKYLNLLGYHGYYMAYNDPTHGKTYLDHFAVKNTLEIKTIVCETSITDHFIILASIETSTTVFPSKLKGTPKINFNRLYF